VKVKQYKCKETGEIYRIKGFGTRIEESGKSTTMIWIIKTNNPDAKAEFVRACDFDNNFESI